MADDRYKVTRVGGPIADQLHVGDVIVATEHWGAERTWRIMDPNTGEITSSFSGYLLKEDR